MRLAIVRMAYSPFGGAETSIEQIRRALAARNENLELTVLTKSWKKSMGCPSSRIHQDIVELPVRGLTRAGQLKLFSKHVDAFVKTHHFDIIQSHERLSRCHIFRAGDGIHASWLKRLSLDRGVPEFILKIDPYHRVVLSAERDMAQFDGPIFVANSPMVAREAEEVLGVPPNRIRHIPNMIDTSSVALPTPNERHRAKLNLNLNPNHPILLFVGSGFERKGAFHLVRAMSHLKDTQLVIVGKDRQTKKLQMLIHQLGLSHRVHIAGPQMDLLPYWYAADVFCLPSLYDSFPNAALEALAHGIPCVLSDGVGVVETFEAQGVAVKTTRDEVEIAHAVMTCLSNSGELAKRARVVAEHYTPKFVLPKWIDLYDEVMAATR
jgi:UDP-glucose:(heptosyl)LPS alpha-1,3-glucosyltransferase